jgi:hypothetical protein
MLLEGPALVVSQTGTSVLAANLARAAFPLLDVTLREAPAAIAAMRPAFVVVDRLTETDETAAAALVDVTHEIDGPWTPILRIAAADEADHDVWFGTLRVRAADNIDALVKRLHAMQRLRRLDASVKRRTAILTAAGGPALDLAGTDPLAEASVLVVGRGRAYPGIALRFAERVTTVGAFGLEAALDMLRARDIDGIVLADGFAGNRIDWFLSEIARDTSLRDLPVALVAAQVDAVPDGFGHVEMFGEHDADLLPVMLPALRCHAFGLRLKRMARAVEAEGLIDPRTSLLTLDAFRAQLAAALDDVAARGAPLSVARLSFPQPTPPRLVADASRVLARLIRASDFGGLDQDGLLLALGDTDIKEAHNVVRRLAAIVKHTTLDPMGLKLVPDVVLDAARPGDDAPAMAKRIGARGL